MNFVHRIKKAILAVVLIWFSGAQAGSYDDFFLAIRQDDAAAVQALLQRGFDVNTLDPQAQHGLLLALRAPSVRVAEVLLAWPRVEVEFRSPQDESPLMLAAIHGLLPLCDRLIALGADVNKPGWTPLHYAASRGHLRVMDLLLEHHAYIDAESPNRSTPLMMAAQYGSPSAVKLLLEAGADPTLKNEQGLSALDFAHRGNRAESAAIISAFVRGRQPKGSW